MPVTAQRISDSQHHDIPLSGTLDASVVALHEDDLCICEKNWAGAEADPALLQSLIDKEVAEGWLHPVPSLDYAKARWKHLAVGKMNIVHSIGRKPRLVVDSSICGTNSACFVPETYTLPSIQTVMDSFPLREVDCALAAFSLDIKAAHKTIRVRQSEQGLLGVRIGDKFLFYSVCPFVLLSVHFGLQDWVVSWSGHCICCFTLPTCWLYMWMMCWLSRMLQSWN